MSDATPNAEAIAKLIKSREPYHPHSADRVSKVELKTWTVEEMEGVLEQLAPRMKKAGSNEPCGPEFNRHSSLFKWMRIPFWSMFAIGFGILVPMQVYGFVHLLLHRRFKAIWKELPVPTILLFNWSSSTFSFVKAPPTLIRKSVQQQAALCVNRVGKFAIKNEGYAVLSHVWAETCGWATLTDWGPVEPEVRKQGIYYDHFLKFFDRCDAEWLWVDLLAMPEVFDDMTSSQKSDTEELRTGVINSLRNIYTRADKVVILDSLLLRLRSGGMIDAAVILCLGCWAQRLWPFTEIKLAKRVILKTEDSYFDLDSIMDFLYETVGNEDHRYFILFTRLIPLRPEPAGQRRWISSPLRPDARGPNVFVDIYSGTENRNCDVEIDHARALYPLLDLQWQTGWTLQQGLRQIAECFPDEKDILIKYCEYRGISLSWSFSDDT
ncbi:MAG: hypothetical protein Q9175_004052 [Cornicularia normoerica]